MNRLSARVLPLRRAVVPDDQIPQKVITLDDRARDLAETLEPYQVRARQSVERRVAIMLVTRAQGIILAFGSAPTEWVRIDMGTEADAVLMSVGWRRTSGWQMISGFETCDIERDA